MNTNQSIKSNAIFTFIVPCETPPTRIDRYITEQFSHYSRSFFATIIDKGYVSINSVVTIKQSTLVKPADTIVLQFPPDRTVETEKISTATLNVAIIHMHDHFMIINKPANLLIHAPSQTSNAVTLVDWIEQNHTDIKQIGSIDRPGIVHRLDKDTSGTLIITRTNHAHQVFTALFKNREIQKTYIALVVGHPDKEGEIDYAIGRDPHNRIKMKAFNYATGGTTIRTAKSFYKVLEYFNNSALVEVKPITGRTHQIRVHMTAIGHPIIGDQLYGSPSPLITRQALHAYTISFVFDGISHSFTQDVPDDFQHLINEERRLKASFE